MGSTSGAESCEGESEGDLTLPNGCRGEAEFEQFLANIGYGHFYRSTAEEEPSPRTKASPPRRDPIKQRPRRAGKTLALAALPVVAVAAIVSSFAVWGALAEKRASAEAKEFAERGMASPGFSLEHFRAVRPGMTSDELRDLLGLPLSRRDAALENAEQCWVYTVPGGREGRMPLCSVWLTTGRVVRAEERMRRHVRSESLPPPARPVQRVGDMVLTLDDGSKCELHAAEAAAAVLLDPLCDLDVRSLAASSGSVLRVAAAEAAQDGSLRALPRSMSVYFEGDLYLVPSAAPGLPEDLPREDIEWLLAHLH